MNSITQYNRIFPTNCGVVSTTRGELCGYLHEIISKFFYVLRGTLFDKKGFRFYRKEPRTHVFFKADISLCVQKLDLQQACKYGAIFYLAAAMLLLTTGIYSRQIRPVAFEEPAAVHTVPAPTAFNIDRPAGSLAADNASESTAVQKSATALPELEEPALPFEDHIMQAAQTYQVDPTLIHAIIMAESSYNPRAVSHRGAQGLMQLMPTTAKWLGIRDSFDPAMNIDGGVRYFKKLLDRFDGDVKLALAAYNAGSRYVRKYGGVPPFKATRIYIKKVLHYHRVLQDQLAAGGGNGLTTG
jgi:soluble lytic murein transglycosylase-like protein